MDHQGLCSDRDNPYSGSGFITRPNAQFSWVYKYAVSMAATWLSMFSMPTHAWPLYDSKTYSEAQEGLGEDTDTNYDDDYDDDDANEPHQPVETINGHAEATPPPPKPQPPPGPQAKVEPDATFTRPCDLKSDLYILQPERLNSSTPLKV